MNESAKNLLICELSTVKSYIDRLFHACIEVRNLSSLPEFTALSSALFFDIEHLFEEELFKENFTSYSEHFLIHPKEIRERVFAAIALIQNFLGLNFDYKNSTKLGVEFINLLYDHAHKIHVFCHKKTDLLIVYPPLSVLKEKSKTGDIVAFYLDIDSVTYIGDQGNLSSLTLQREKSYDKLIRQGHQAIYEKRPLAAQDFFKKAAGYNETAEVLGLIAWTHSLIGNMKLAKELALKAIDKDPDYGPPYNDLGTYYLAENSFTDALYWFEKAKVARDYQHREFPYINTGKVYIIQNKYQKALDEFSYALNLAPYNEELQEALRQLKEVMSRKSKFRNLDNDLKE